MKINPLECCQTFPDQLFLILFQTILRKEVEVRHGFTNELSRINTGVFNCRPLIT